MLLEIIDIEPLKSFLDIIYEGSLTTLVLKLLDDKLSINLLNNSHVAFYNLELDKEFFIRYEVDDLNELSVDLGDFHQIIKSAKKNDTLIIESDGMYITFIFESDTNRRVFEVPFVDDTRDTPTPPMIDYEGEVVVSIDDLKIPCNDLDSIIGTDRFQVTANKDGLIVSAPKDSMTKYSNNIHGFSSIDTDMTTVVDLKYIQEITILSKINKDITFNLGDTIPVSWNILSPDELVKVSGLIAPIIDAED